MGTGRKLSGTSDNVQRGVLFVLVCNNSYKKSTSFQLSVALCVLGQVTEKKVFFLLGSTIKPIKNLRFNES